MGRKAEITKRTRAVWEHGSVIGGPGVDHGWRYVPRSYRIPGKFSWGVWDRVEDRFIENEELLAVPVDQLASARLPNSVN